MDDEARFGAAVKIFKANAAEYFGHRKSIGVSAGDERGIAKNPEGWLPCAKGAGIFRRKMTEGL